MKKLTIFLPLITLFFASSAEAHWSNESFHSWNKPLNANMANYDTMKKYRADVNAYTKKLDDEIKRLQAKKQGVIAEFNAAASEYNNDDFFHKGSPKIELIGKNKHKLNLNNKEKKELLTDIINILAQ